MKETGLIFKAPLVRAILEGRKTQTRRVIKDQAIGERWCEARADGRQYLEWQGQPTCGSGVWDIPEYNAEIVSPLGLIGDRIYVRETWAEIPRHQPQTDEDLPMRKDGRILVYQADPEWDGSRNFLCADGCMRWAKPDRWRPSIHMPKEFARIWLEITSVRVERLQSITEADCIVEGAAGGHGAIPGYQYSATPLEHFRHIWESTGGDWAANPWVWVIDFKTIRTTGRPA